jgi:uncharacterized membrane protein
MKGAGKYVWAALIVAIVSHVAFIHAMPRLRMGVAIERLSAEGFNTWRVADRVTPMSRTIVRPSPDFAYSACVYDLGNGPITITATPWHDYWSLSLYAANSDNYFVIDDREARNGANVTLVRQGRAAPEDALRVVEGPSRRGIAIIRRLAPDLESYNAAAAVARGDSCGAAATAAPVGY